MSEILYMRISTQNTERERGREEGTARGKGKKWRMGRGSEGTSERARELERGKESDRE